MNSKLADSILGALKTTKQPMLTVDIAKAVGLQTRSQVNPTIYALEKAGSIIKVQAQPPIWKLAEDAIIENTEEDKSKVLYLTEGAFISLSDVIPLLENETLTDIIYFTTNIDEANETNGVNYQAFGKMDDYSAIFFCNVMLLTSEPTLDVYVCYDESQDLMKQLFNLPLISKSNIKTINSLHELV